MILPPIDAYMTTGESQSIECFINQVFCTDALTLLGALPDNSVDLIITSPPYDGLRTYNGYSFNFQPTARESYRVLKSGGVLVWVVGDSVVNGSETLTSMRQALYFVDVIGFRMHDTMIYEKDGLPFSDPARCYQVWEYMFVLSKGAPKTTKIPRVQSRKEVKTTGPLTRMANGSKVRMTGKTGNSERNMINVWKFGTGGGKGTKDKFAFEHPAIFPEKLAERHILTWSNPGDIVLDYFLGSGTTAKMARNNERRYIGCDISQEYVQIANRRLAMPYTPNLFEVEPAETPATQQLELITK
jgi:site-specific DNA-methyltransferase (adenine-specific)